MVLYNIVRILFVLAICKLIINSLCEMAHDFEAKCLDDYLKGWEE